MRVQMITQGKIETDETVPGFYPWALLSELTAMAGHKIALTRVVRKGRWLSYSFGTTTIRVQV